MIRKIAVWLGLAEENDYAAEEKIGEDKEERINRMLSEPPPAVRVVCYFPTEDAPLQEELAESLKQGVIVVLNIKNFGAEKGQSLLDFLCGVIYTLKGTIFRISPGVFIASPNKGWVEKCE